MHHMDANKKHREKARCGLHKNTMTYFEQIREETPHKTTAVRPLTSHLKKPSKQDEQDMQGRTYK